MSWLQSFLAALVIFTRIPVRWTLPAAAFTRASLQLPLLGCFVGAVQWGILLLASRWMNRDLALFLAMIFPCILSAGMHEDGLADFADGMLGGQTVSRRLEIMKDPRVGAYGVLALIIVLAGGFLALRGTVDDYQGPVLLVVAVFSRALCIPLLGTLPYLNHAGSRSQGFIPDSLTGWRIILPLWPLLIIFMLGFETGITALFFFVFVLLFWLLRRYLQKKLEGLTGDCLGAAIKLGEVGFYFLGAIYWSK